MIMVSELLQEMSVPLPIVMPASDDVTFLLMISPADLISKSPSKDARDDDELAEDKDIESKDLSELQYSSKARL